MLEALQRKWINLASEKLGAAAIACSDDFFAPMARMISDAEPVFIPDKYDDNGKWMDGWESRRKRGEGYDHCIVALCKAGVIHGVDIDTCHFTGNYAPAASIEACYSPDGAPTASSDWQELVAATPLEGNSHHPIAIEDDTVYSHVRINIFPDGGVARLRVYGSPSCDWGNRAANEVVDLAAMLQGGRAIACNNEHFGSMHNLFAPGRGVNMGDGWETRSRREPGHDWVILALGHAGTIQSVEIDTAHFKGNFPHQCSIQGAFMQGVEESTLAQQSLYWQELLPKQLMQMDHIHNYASELVDIGPITHARLNIFPDGGVSRLRLNGTIHRP
ncbi:MAG: allantoicase [Pseudomonadota bacterium]